VWRKQHVCQSSYWQQFRRFNPSVYTAALLLFPALRGGCCTVIVRFDVNLNKRRLLWSLLLLHTKVYGRPCYDIVTYGHRRRHGFEFWNLHILLTWWDMKQNIIYTSLFTNIHGSRNKKTATTTTTARKKERKKPYCFIIVVMTYKSLKPQKCNHRIFIYKRWNCN